MKRQYNIGRIFGIKISLHYSWFIIAILLSWALATGYFPEFFPGLAQQQYWGIAIASAILLFVSVLFHEISHALVAKHHKIPIKQIQLFFFGGVAFMDDEKITPRTEFIMALAGPLCSLVLASIFFTFQPQITNIYGSAILHYLARINLVLGIFNLAPGFPLDGGRALRAVIWMVTKDFEKATYIASRSGKFIGGLLVFLGFINIFSGNLAGLWFVLIGGFLFFLAEMSYEQIMLRKILKGKKVKDVMLKKFQKIEEDQHIDEIIKDYFLVYKQPIYPVYHKDKLLGILSIEKIKEIPLQQRHKELVHDHYIPIKRFPRVKDTDDVYKSFVKLVKQNKRAIPVLKNNKLVGILSQQRVVSLLRSKIKKK